MIFLFIGIGIDSIGNESGNNYVYRRVKASG